jgi:hypothetical protein
MKVVPQRGRVSRQNPEYRDALFEEVFVTEDGDELFNPIPNRANSLEDALAKRWIAPFITEES